MRLHALLVFCSACTVLLILACFFAGCSSYSASPAPAASTISPAGGSAITIKNFAFDPAVLTVKPGTTVTWLNQDPAPHAIASDTTSAVAFSSESLANGASYAFTFTRPGTYTYHCSIHPSMTGTIVVQS
jgi:plastocyanin